MMTKSFLPFFCEKRQKRLNFSRRVEAIQLLLSPFWKAIMVKYIDQSGVVGQPSIKLKITFFCELWTFVFCAQLQATNAILTDFHGIPAFFAHSKNSSSSLLSNLSPFRFYCKYSSSTFYSPWNFPYVLPHQTPFFSSCQLSRLTSLIMHEETD